MPRGPKGERRPGDVIGAAVMVVKIAAREIEENLTKPSGKARSAKMAALERWVK